MYSNSRVNSGSRPREPAVKTCKLLFRAPFRYESAKTSEDNTLQPFIISHSDSLRCDAQNPILLKNQGEANETNAGTSFGDITHRNLRSDSHDFDSIHRDTWSSNRQAAYVRSQSMNVAPTFSGNIPCQSGSCYLSTGSNKLVPAPSASSRHSLQPKGRNLVAPKESSFHAPKVLKPGPMPAQREEEAMEFRGGEPTVPDLVEEKTGAEQQQNSDSLILEVKAADIARIYKVNQFPKSISKNLFLDNYRSVLGRPKNAKRRAGEEGGGKKKSVHKTVALCSEDPYCCPHCSTEDSTKENDYDSSHVAGKEGRSEDNCIFDVGKKIDVE